MSHSKRVTNRLKVIIAAIESRKRDPLAGASLEYSDGYTAGLDTALEEIREYIWRLNPNLAVREDD